MPEKKKPASKKPGEVCFGKCDYVESKVSKKVCGSPCVLDRGHEGSCLCIDHKPKHKK